MKLNEQETDSKLVNSGQTNNIGVFWQMLCGKLYEDGLNQPIKLVNIFWKKLLTGWIFSKAIWLPISNMNIHNPDIKYINKK